MRRKEFLSNVIIMVENRDYEDKIAMACIVTASVFGLISNGLSLYVMRTRSCFRNAFGILCSSFLVCNLQTIFVLFTWCTIVLTVKSPVLSTSKSFWARLVGLLVNGACFASFAIHFFVAFNRLCAVVYPIKYNQLWSEARAFIAGIISWTLGMAIGTMHLFEDCSLIFNENSSYYFYYRNSIRGVVCRYTDSGLSIILVLIVACIDVTTFIKMLAYRKARLKNAVMPSSDTINGREVLFFRQSCSLNFIYISFFIILAIHPFLFTNKWLLFALSTMIFIIMPSTDELVLLIFNRKMILKTVWIVPEASTTYPQQTTTRF
ncbi:Serpentine receptor class X [Dirofilaria immitis]